MLYFIIAMLTLNTALLYYASWHLVDYLKWKRSFKDDDNV
jgi:hypothetical protein